MAKRRRATHTTINTATDLDLILNAINRLTRTLREANQQRDELVEEARELGASWHRISQAAEMTPQGANQKWRSK